MIKKRLMLISTISIYNDMAYIIKDSMMNSSNCGHVFYLFITALFCINQYNNFNVVYAMFNILAQ